MNRIGTYLKLSWLFTLSLFLPTAPLTVRIDRLLAELKSDPSGSH